jgi:hypothetical protein
LAKFTQPEPISHEDGDDRFTGEEVDSAAIIMTLGSGVQVQKATNAEIQEAQ